MKSLIFFIITNLFISSFASAETLRDQLRKNIEEKIEQKIQEKEAPKVTPNTDQKILRIDDYIFSLKVGEYDRYYKVHVPNKYDAKKAIPILFVFHGGGSDMEIQSTEKYSHQISQSEEGGYLVVFPNGFSRFRSGQIATWNAGKCCAEARDKNVDDVLFVKMILDKLKKQFVIDEKRIFATGMSNGGMFSYRLACEMSDVFKGISSVAGTDNTINCTPKKPISIMHIHAKDDGHVLFNGGAGPESQSRYLVTDYVSVPKTIEKWVKLNGCNEKPKRVIDMKSAYCDLYSPCKDNTEVKLCVTETGGHSWPGGEKPRPRADTPTQAISASKLNWEFFQNK
jgi:polyhydroxybutyrate depolymerase